MYTYNTVVMQKTDSPNLRNRKSNWSDKILKKKFSFHFLELTSDSVYYA